MQNLLQYARQPTTLAGLSTLVAAAFGLGFHQMTGLQAVPVIAGALVAILVTDNTKAIQDAQALALALLKLQAGDPTQIGPVVNDAINIAADVAAAERAPAVPAGS